MRNSDPEAHLPGVAQAQPHDALRGVQHHPCVRHGGLQLAPGRQGRR